MMGLKSGCVPDEYSTYIALPEGNAFPMFMQCRILGGDILRSALNCSKRCSQLTKYSFSGATLKSLRCISLQTYDL